MNVTDRVRYLVYTRRLGIEALKTKALLLASLNSENAQAAAEEYMDLAVPYDKAHAAAEQWEKEQVVKRFTEMGPIKAGDIRAPSIAPVPFVDAQSENGRPAHWSKQTSMRRR